MEVSAYEDSGAHYWIQAGNRRVVGRGIFTAGAGVDVLSGAAGGADGVEAAMNLANAVAALGDGPLCEEAIARHIAPLFSRVLASERIYLANHSLGRPLDAMAEDVAEATALWYGKLGDAWDDWLAEREAFRGTRCAADWRGARGLHCSEDCGWAGFARRTECASGEAARGEHAGRIRFSGFDFETVCGAGAD